jgi:hypothetical protein
MPQSRSSYFWTVSENIKYKEFLLNNIELFLKNREERKVLKINVLMSRHIKTRNSRQCRSHHQKMLGYYGDLLSLVSHIEGE